MNSPVDHRQDWAAVLAAWSLAGVFVGVVDFALIPLEVLTAASFGELLFALIGNALRVSLIAGVLVGALLHLRSVVPAPARLLPTLVAVLTLPYAGWLAWFMFSGAQARAHSLRWPAMGVVTVVVTLAAAAFAMLLVKRWRSERSSVALGGVAQLGALACLLISQHVRPDEYVPLHAFLGGCAVLASGGGFTELTRSQRVRSFSTPPRRRAAALVVACVVVASVFAQGSSVSWILSSHTGFARYVGNPFGGDGALPSDAARATPRTPWEGRAAASAVREQAAARPAPNIVLFFIDNVQADHVGAYGYRRRPTTPNVDGLAQGGVVFERAFSVFPQTRNFSCMLLFGRFIPTFSAHEFPQDYVRDSLPLQLAKRNYRMFVHAIFEETDRTSFDSRDYGLAGHRSDAGLSIPEIDVDALLAEAEAHAAAAKAAGQPFLVWVHLLRPHWVGGSFAAPEGSFRFGDERLDLYDGNIAMADAVLPRLEAIADRHAGGRGTVWVVASDHGAGLPLHGQGKTLLSVHTHVPLVIRAPGFPAGRVKRAVELPLDLGPTLLDLCGLEAPASWEGVSLVPDLLGNDIAERPVMQHYTGGRLGLVHGDWKYVRRDDVTSLADLSTDPTELKNLSKDRPEVLRRMDATVGALFEARQGAYRRATQKGEGEQ